MRNNTSNIQADNYRRLVRRKSFILGALFIALIFSVLLNLSLGPASYNLIDVAKSIFIDATENKRLHAIIWQIRFPVALMAVVVGAALSLAGAQMQTVLNNPLAGPFTLGISAAASFGAALTIAFGVRLLPVAAEYIIPLNAFLMAALAGMTIHFLSLRRGTNAQTVILLGIALVFTFNSLVALVQYFSTDEAVSAVVFWTMGSLTKATWTNLTIVSVMLLIILPVFIKQSWALSAMRLGDAKAESLGVNIKRLRLFTLLLVSILASLPVAFVGTIGFIGLVGPHIARMIIGEDQRFFIPAAILIGALILSLSSVLSKTLISGVIFPIGIITSLIGVPFFLSLILSKKQQIW